MLSEIKLTMTVTPSKVINYAKKQESITHSKENQWTQN